jgi:hypothetical protein
MFTMSNVAYTLAVIENGYAAWDKIHKKSAQQGRDEDSTRNGDGNTRIVKVKYTSHSDSKRQYSHSGWNQDGIDFYDWVKNGVEETIKQKGLQRLDGTRRQGCPTWKRSNMGIGRLGILLNQEEALKLKI